jgi:hypothetical protein
MAQNGSNVLSCLVLRVLFLFRDAFREHSQVLTNDSGTGVIRWLSTEFDRRISDLYAIRAFGVFSIH